MNRGSFHRAEILLGGYSVCWVLRFSPGFKSASLPPLPVSGLAGFSTLEKIIQHYIISIIHGCDKFKKKKTGPLSVYKK